MLARGVSRGIEERDKSPLEVLNKLHELRKKAKEG
jgi:hypothetical protein